MRPEQDVYSIDTEDNPDVYCLDRADCFEPQPGDGDSIGAAAVLQKKSCAARRDDRKSDRNRVPEARQSCELNVGDNLIPALLMDESRDGFAVMIDRLEGVKSGKKAKLRTDAGWVNVRIIYITKAAPPAYSDPKSDCWFRLGLRKARSFFLF
jgi:hypothetical protein